VTLPPVDPLPPIDILPPIFDRPALGRPFIPERPVIVPPVVRPDQATTLVAPERPMPPDRPSPAQDVKDLVKEFQAVRQDFLEGQRELQRMLKDATQEQRAVIREKLRDNLNEWREAQKAHILDLREQAKEIRNNVPAIRDVIDGGRGEGRGR
jgi:hypothetical protein